jgi:hypothetical protein
MLNQIIPEPQDGDIIHCSDCKKEFVYYEDETDRYQGEPICEKCYDEKYGWCDECGWLFKYQELFIQGDVDYKLCSDCCDKMGLSKDEKFCD